MCGFMSKVCICKPRYDLLREGLERGRIERPSLSDEMTHGSEMPISSLLKRPDLDVTYS